MMDEKILHHGRVTDRQGTGVGDALVYVVQGTASTPEIAVKCDAAGHFRLALPPGQFRIEARSMAGAVGSTEIEVSKGDEKIAITIDH
ncbi:carboxypeptidase-like regulatory domain-containing protein [Bradyrhizobium sp. 18]|uniref:carboxypeptidase regulatory-like domain-containing protein n=1 Tax=Bradyrhizobium sp. 18 TaxID=2782657 RepID=UPI001FF865E3|nr:carboxypeptidase-like regulatory domain-containing protein [Bradyrhizobium sp. 18]MCK1506841.1 carboxypeptidase regulatory-like domain-containing protein [Bradyrhizobium sp. 18]